ncbi:MAG: hypothetical protein ABEH80_09010 [Halobaculum sp.]
MTSETSVHDIVESGSNRSTSNPSLGTHRGYEVHIAVSRKPPDASVPDEFGVNCYIPREDGDNIDIARVDTDHGGVHIDRFYLPEGHEKRRHDFDFSTDRPAGAIKYFTDNQRWRDWVERYDENHGLP